MVISWGIAEDISKLEKDSVKEAIITKLKEKGSLSLKELIAYLWKDYKLITNFFKIVIAVEELERDGIIIRSSDEMRLTEISVFNGDKIIVRKTHEIVFGTSKKDIKTRSIDCPLYTT